MKILTLKPWRPRFNPRPSVNVRRLSMGRSVRLLVEALEDRVVPAVASLPGNINLQAQAAAIGNLGLANGLTGWNVSKGDTGLVSVVTRWVAQGGTDPTTKTSIAPRSYNPEGDNSHFAVLKTAGPDSVTTLSTTFTVGPGGQGISFSAFFDAGDYAPYNDYGDIVLYQGATPLVTLFAANILGGAGMDSKPAVPLLAPRVGGDTTRSAVGGYGNTAWTPVRYAITEPATYTLQARTSNTGDNALDSYLGFGNFQLVRPAIHINVGAPMVAPTGTLISRNVTFTDSVVDPYSVEIDPGTGTFVPFGGPLFASAVPGGTNSFDWTGSFAKPGTYYVICRVHDVFSHSIDTYQDAILVVNVFLPRQFASLGDTDTQLVTNSNQAANAGIAGTALDGSAMHMTAALGSAAGASVFAGSYIMDPTDSMTGGRDLIKIGADRASGAAPMAFFDLRTAGVDAASTLTTTFIVELDPALDLSAIKVLYNDGGDWLPVVPDPELPITKIITGIDPGTGKEIVKIQFTATKNSQPSVLDLHGTVFTIALPAPQTAPVTIPVSGPVATLNAVPPVTPLATSFSSDSAGTFVLRVSQGADFSASRTEASSSSAGPVTGSNSVNDPANVVQTVEDMLDINWLLRALSQRGEEHVPGRPAARDERNRANQTPGPEGESLEAAETVQADVINTMFANKLYEQPDPSAAALSLLAPRSMGVDADRGTRLDAGWALLTAAMTIGPVIMPGEGERKKVRL